MPEKEEKEVKGGGKWTERKGEEEKGRDRMRNRNTVEEKVKKRKKRQDNRTGDPVREEEKEETQNE